MQKYAAIAEAIKISRRNLYISQNQLANLSNYSRTTISMIEAGKRKPTDEFLIVLSNILNFDFITLAQKVENYQTLEHYLIANELLKYISLHDTYTISTLLDNEIVKKEFTYGEPLIIKEYCSILVFTHIDKDLSGAYSACV